MKGINTQNLWTFDLGTKEGINTPVWVIVGFQQRDRQDSQKLNNDRFYRPPETITQCIIVKEKILSMQYYKIVMMMIIVKDMD